MRPKMMKKVEQIFFVFECVHVCRSPATAHNNHHGPPMAHPPSEAAPVADKDRAVLMATVAFAERRPMPLEEAGCCSLS